MTTDTPRTDKLRDGIKVRSALRTFIVPQDVTDALELAETLERDLAAMRERVVKYRARLEVDGHYVCADGKNTERVDLPFDEDEPYDGIECRDTTIRMLDAARVEILDDLAECRAALRELVACKDLKDRIDRERDACQFGLPARKGWWDDKDDYVRRKPLAWSTARALATKDKEPQS